MKRLILTLLSCGLVSCNPVSEQSDGIFLDCVGERTFEAKNGTLVEPHREIIFVAETEQDVRKGNELGASLCGSEDEILWKSFDDDKIFCKHRFDDPEMPAITTISIDRVSGQLSMVTQDFFKGEFMGLITVNAACKSLSSSPKNKF